MNDRKVVIVDAVRTPWGKAFGCFDKLDASDLSAALLPALLQRAGIHPDKVGQVVFGQGHPSTLPGNIGHYAWLKAQLPVEVPGYTVQAVTGSALQAVRNAYYLIKSGNEEICIAGGVDSYSAAPFVMRNVRSHFYERDRLVIDTLEEGERCTQPIPLSRIERHQNNYPEQRLEAVDTYIEESVRNAKKYVSSTTESIVPISYIQRKKGEIVVSQDEYLQTQDTPANNLARYADGAAAMAIMSDTAAAAAGAVPVAELAGFAVSGGNYERPSDAGVAAVQKLLERSGLSIDQISGVEILENSADEVLEIKEKLHITCQCNPCGGALAFGLCDGAEGIFMMLRMLYELQSGEYGVCCVYSAGGIGIAALLKKC